MGLLNKLKNALFEEEYVEVEEKPKKIKKERPKEKEKEEKPIAKKVILPGRKDQKVEEIHEEELVDEDFEIRPKSEVKKEEVEPEEVHNDFKIMDDNDFKMDDEIPSAYEEPEIVKVIDKKEDFVVNDDVNDEPEYYTGKKEEYEAYQPVEEKKLYGGETNTVKVHEYGGYEKKEEKTYFKPSPIISPIYGILDKNYKKEDVVSKKEVRLSSSYAKRKVSVDEVRNKAYGQLSDDIEREMIDNIDEDETKFSLEKQNVEDEDINILVDLSDEKEKPAVKEVTVGDAVEYFQDLGLEYNVDYVDATKEQHKKKEEAEVKPEEPKRRRREVIINDYEDDSQNVMEIEEKDIPIEEDNSDLDYDLNKDENKEEKVESTKNENDSNIDKLLDTDDNLFDLIDSMYQENE